MKVAMSVDSTTTRCLAVMPVVLKVVLVEVKIMGHLVATEIVQSMVCLESNKMSRLMTIFTL